MSVLKIVVAHHVGETPASLCSRLAQANGRERMLDFALDVGLDLAGVVAGLPEPLDRLADLCGCCPDMLREWAPMTVDGAAYLRGEHLGRRKLRRNRIFACTACLLADLENVHIDREVRPWGRAIWQVRSLRTCHIHHQELKQVAHTMQTGFHHDFAALVSPAIADLPDLHEASERRTPSRLEDYVHTHLTAGSGRNGFLDGLPLYAVTRTCETLGAVIEYGPEKSAEDLTEHDLWMAGESGFEAMSKGEQGIRSALDRLQSAFQITSGDWGISAFYGRFHDWLARDDDRVYDPIRDIVFRHTVDTLPVGPGEFILNREVTERRMHSMHSASREFGLHPKRLRKILIAEGILAPEDAGKHYERILIPVDRVAKRAAELSDAMSLTKAQSYLNSGEVQTRLLFEAGIIRPIVLGGTLAHSSHGFLKDDLDAFLSKLRSSCRPGVRGVTIPRAARRAKCASMFIVTLLLEGRLKKVGLDEKELGYLSVLVDVPEVISMLDREDPVGLSLQLVERRMHWSTAVLTALIDRGHLPSAEVRNPVTGRRQRIVRETDLQAFDDTFVSLHSAATERGIHSRKLKADLASLGVMPDPAFVGVPATFFRRSEIEEALPRS